MSDATTRRPILAELYEQFLADRDQAAFIHRVAERYHTATLERLVLHRTRWVRRGSVLALGAIADFSSNAVLGHALIDADRGVRILAESAIRSVWCRDGSWNQQQELARVIGLNASEKHDAARTAATRLIDDNGSLAESWSTPLVGSNPVLRKTPRQAPTPRPVNDNVMIGGFPPASPNNTGIASTRRNEFHVTQTCTLTRLADILSASSASLMKLCQGGAVAEPPTEMG